MHAVFALMPRWKATLPQQQQQQHGGDNAVDKCVRSATGDTAIRTQACRGIYTSRRRLQDEYRTTTCLPLELIVSRFSYLFSELEALSVVA